MGIGPIPASCIDRMTAHMHYEDAEMFEYCIRKMDEAYLKWEPEEEVAPGPPPRFADLARGR